MTEQQDILFRDSPSSFCLLLTAFFQITASKSFAFKQFISSHNTVTLFLSADIWKDFFLNPVHVKEEFALVLQISFRQSFFIQLKNMHPEIAKGKVIE